MMIPVYVSNGTFITMYNGRDYHLYSVYGRQLHADGFEFLMYNCWGGEVEELRKYLKTTGLAFPVMHLDKDIGEVLATDGKEGIKEAKRIFLRDLITAETIGAKKLVMHMWNGLNSDSRFNETLDMYGEMHCEAVKRGFVLATENVTCKRNLSLDHLLEIKRICPEAAFTWDTKMAFLHGENALLGSEKYADVLGSVRHLHVNDSKTPEPGKPRLPILHIGDGEVDFDAFFGLMKRSGFDGSATVESSSTLPDGSVMVEKLNRTLDTIRARLNG